MMPLEMTETFKACPSTRVGSAAIFFLFFIDPRGTSRLEAVLSPFSFRL